MAAAPAVPPTTGEPGDEDDVMEEAIGDEAAAVKEGTVDGKKDKRKKHDGETAEERAERKRRKKEKKEKKEKKSKKQEESDSN